MLKLQQLRYFQTACRLQSITGAAEALHISQPSISVAIRELEQEFGVKLTSRRYQGFALTEEGRQLLSMADGLLEHADQVAARMQDIGRRHYPIRLGVPPMIGAVLLPRLYGSFLPRNPQITVTTEEGGAKSLLRNLLEKTLDLAFVAHSEPLPEAFSAVPVVSTETVWCVAQDHPLRCRSTVTVDELRQEPLVLFQKDFFQYEIVMHRFQEAVITPRIIHATGQLSTVHRLVRSGVASGFLLKNTLEELPDLVGISLDPPIPAQISLAWERGRHLSNDMRRMIEEFQQDDTPE